MGSLLWAPPRKPPKTWVILNSVFPLVHLSRVSLTIFFSCVCPLPFITDTLLIHIHYFSPRWQHKLLSFFSHQQYPSSAAYQLHSLSWSSVPPSTPKDSRLRNILFPECLPNEIIYFGLHQVQTARPYIKSLKQPGVTYFFWKKQLSLALRAIQSLSRSLNSAVVWKQP